MIRNKLFKGYKSAQLFLFSIVFLIFWTSSYSQLGNPFIQNFSKNEIKKDAKVFDISQSKNGEMYFATAGALLEFDGFRWLSYTAKQESDLRAVLYMDDQHIYTSGHGGFGFWSKNSRGILVYTSLFFKHPTKTAPLLPIFYNIVEVNGAIFFQSFQQIYSYSPTTRKLTIITALKGFNSMFSSNNRAFVQDVSIGLLEIINSKKEIIKGTQMISFDIIGVFEEKDKSLLIATKYNGFWHSKKGVLLKKEWVINDEIKKGIITSIKKYSNGKFIVGTLRSGFYIISDDGTKVAHFNKNNGIENNAIRAVFKDSNNNIWLGTESGISYVEVNSDTKYLLDSKSTFGTVYTSFLNDSLLYLGTNQGLFIKNIKKPQFEPKLIGKNTGQIWNIDKIDNQILVGSHQGLSLINKDSLETIHIEGGAWVFKKHPKIKDLMYVGFYSGIAVFKKVDNQWKFFKKFENFGESSRFIEFDQYGQIWVAHPSKGYYRLILSNDGLALNEVEFYGVENPNIEAYAYLCKIDENLVFYNPKGFFYYDAIDNSFTKAKYPSEIFKGLKNINYIYQDENIFWYSTANSIGYVLRNGNQFTVHQDPFFTIWDTHLKDFNKIEKINNDNYAIGIENGIIFHSISSKVKTVLNTVPTIKLIEFISATDTIIAPIEHKNVIKIPYGNKFLKIKIALPNIPLSNSREYQYRLKGLEKGWSTWIYETEIKFPGLTSGKYILELRAKAPQYTVFKTVQFPFYIEYPWYINTVAKIIYVCTFLLIFIGYRTYLKRKNEKYVIRLRELEKLKRERQKEKFDLEKMAADKELFFLKEENLKLEIRKKNSALASSTLNNIKKNELLADLIKDIKNIDDELVKSSLHFTVKKVIKKINNHLIDKEDWLTFQLHFSNSHAQFFQNLREKHPALSSNEIKLSAYLKLNLSSKEIASLMNVAITSVEQSRYRLRKKFNLDKDENLVNYIQKV